MVENISSHRKYKPKANQNTSWRVVIRITTLTGVAAYSECWGHCEVGLRGGGTETELQGLGKPKDRTDE